jgi:GT2 family glycosyltransferase
VQSGSRPVVSVIIPAYNVQSYIAATLQSALNQTFRSFEIIVVDDGSTDDTQVIAQSYRDRGVLVLTQSNSGPAAARNRALSIATGEYIACLDSDDLWEPDYLKTMIDFLGLHPEVSIVFSDTVFFGKSKFSGKRFQEVYPPSTPITFTKLAGFQSHVAMSATLRREVFDRLGLFDEHLRGSEDFDLWLRALHAGYRIEPVPKVLVRYRRHASSVSSDGSNMFSEVLSALLKWRGQAGLSAEEQQAVEKSCQELQHQANVREALRNIQKGKFRLAQEQLRRVCERSPEWRFHAARLGLALAPRITRLAVLGLRR